MRRWPFLLPLIPALAACAAPRVLALAYLVPAAPVVEYLVGDTAEIEVDAAGQSLALGMTSRARWRMEFAPSDGDRVQVTATLSELAARVTNPVTTAQTADESVVSGPVVFTLDPRGEATILSLPTLSPPAAFQVVSGARIAHAFFPGLPGRVVSAGDSWVDTVAYASEEGEARTSIRTVMEYTVVGDTLVGSRRYLLVRATGTSESSSSGAISGAEFSQIVAGTTDGHFLWDSTAGVLHSLEYLSDLTGTMQVAIVPLPLGVRVRGTLRVMRSEGR